jgi:hypothetical protein
VPGAGACDKGHTGEVDRVLYWCNLEGFC